MKKSDFNRNWTVDGKPVNLPHDAMITEDRDKNSPTGGAGAYFMPGIYEYKKVFDVPAEWSEQTAVLEFGAVYRNASVYVNGERAAFCAYGYTTFDVELDQYLRYGEENEITVVADNSMAPNSRWYTGSGIYRPVYLYTAPKTHIKKDGIVISTKTDGTVNVNVTTVNCDDGTVTLSVIKDKAVAAAASAAVADNKAAAALKIENPALWSDETPELYTLEVKLSAGDCADEETVKFGIREISWSHKGLFINGKETKLRGGCIHHDNGILGSAAFKDTEERKVRILKEAGFNAIRSAHNPASKELLDACDKYGMYVMDESFDMWLIHKNPYDYAVDDFKRDWQKDTRAMVVKDINHPSVIMYSIGNEITSIGGAEGQEMCRKQADFIRSTDSTRAVTIGMNIMLAASAQMGINIYSNDNKDDSKMNGASMDSMPTSEAFNKAMNTAGGLIDLYAAVPFADKTVKAAGDPLDIVGYNYATSRYKKDGKLFPDRTIVGSETLPDSLYKNWQKVEQYPYIIGDFMWTSWDYLGESGIGTCMYKSEENNPGLVVSGGAGVIDICGKIRPENGWDRNIWHLTDKPVIGVCPITHSGDLGSVSMWRKTDTIESWSWAGCEGKPTTVYVFSDKPYIELRVNGKTYGVEKTEEFKAKFENIIYEPGKIEAIARDYSTMAVASAELASAQSELGIRLMPEKQILEANGQDLCFINVDITDASGIIESAKDVKLEVTVEGAGTLQAFGSARPKLTENFWSGEHTTFYGRELAVIRAGYEPGEIKVTVTGEGYEPAVLEIEVK